MQMIFARRNGAVSGEQRDGEELSDMVESRDIVTVARRPSHVARSRFQALGSWLLALGKVLTQGSVGQVRILLTKMSFRGSFRCEEPASLPRDARAGSSPLKRVGMT